MLRKMYALAILLLLISVITSVFIYGVVDATGYTPAGVSLISCTIFPIIFFSLIFISEVDAELRLQANPWVEDVKDMDFWLNPMFFIWLYCHDRKRWTKWTTLFGLLFAPLMGFIIVLLIILPTLNRMTVEGLVTGFFVGTAFTTLLGIVHYERYQVKNETNTG
jgi:Na+-driven multidrug efflux pump